MAAAGPRFFLRRHSRGDDESPQFAAFGSDKNNNNNNNNNNSNNNNNAAGKSGEKRISITQNNLDMNSLKAGADTRADTRSHA